MYMFYYKTLMPLKIKFGLQYQVKVFTVENMYDMYLILCRL